VPDEINDEVIELVKNRILTIENGEDEQILRFVRSNIPEPSISVCYLILSEQCNMACKYCFLGNNKDEIRKSFSVDNMSTETVDKAVDFFVEQLKKSAYNEVRRPAVIFYGGEPLVNYKSLIVAAQKLNKLKNEEPLLKNLDMTVISNGLLLNEQRLLELKRLGVMISISIDGFTSESNSMRVDVNGKPVFEKLLHILNECNRLNVDFSLSVTLSEDSIKSVDNILKLLEIYNVKSLGYNILMSDGTFSLPDSYSKDAAQFIIESFIKLRKIGVYEDRMLRKLDTFAKSQVYYSDCAATSGAQIVIAPDGSVGICHGCIAGKKYFVTDINDRNFKANENSVFKEWSNLSPVNNDNCLDCEALGICGGGCPVNAMHSKPENTLHSIDERFCAHSKSSVEFLIKDLYEQIITGAKNAKES
jgi:uncharacterized protein